MKNLLIIFLVAFSFSVYPLAKPGEQLLPDTPFILRVPGIVVGTDTFAYLSLPIVDVEAAMPFATKRKYAEWTKLKYNVKKAYPYAILASARLKEYEKILEKMPNENARKAYMKVAEKQLQKEFGAELKNLTMTQGRILIKLIDRETGNTSYDLVKQLRGNFSAFMWQSLASLFGSSLKTEYDPEGEDKLIEVAIKQIEAGRI
ncbi:MAG: hypothetical protein K0S33_1359 [Bacteroidetes bacterium]|jgi:hypothetical protein|nr:hypothetical protein [Bacteroidota bacterium]